MDRYEQIAKLVKFGKSYYVLFPNWVKEKMEIDESDTIKVTITKE